MASVDSLYTKIDQGREGKNLGLKTGLPKLDWYTGGFQKGVYKLVYGQSGSGKSSYVIYSDIYRILKDYPDANITYVYFSLEMNESVLLAKILCLYLLEEFGLELSFMDLMSIRKKMSDEDYNKVLKARKWLDTISEKIIIYDKQLSSDDFSDTMTTILKQRGKFVPSADGMKTIYIPNDSTAILNVVIDHAGLLTPKGGRDKKQEIDRCSGLCVRLREVCGVSIDFIMQENRNAGDVNRQKMQLSEPTLDDCKDSGNPANDANIVIAVYYPIKYQLKVYRDYKVADVRDANGIVIESGLGGAIRGLILLKHRFGCANKVFCTGFQGSVGKFVELPKPDVIDYSLYQGWKDDKFEDETESKKEKDAAVKDTVEKDSKPIKYKF